MIRPSERASRRPGMSSAAPARALPAPLRWYFAALCLLTAASVGFELYQHFILHQGYPYDWPLVAPASRFDDVLDWLSRFRSLHTEAFFHESPPVVYPAPMSMVYALLGLLGPAALPAYLLLAALAGGGGLWLFYTALRRADLRRGTALLCAALLLVTSYPFWFLVYTANLELIVAILCAAGILLFCRRQPRWAATCFGLAAALKLTPIVFFLLFTRRRLWPALLQGLAADALVTLASLWGVFPNIARSWRETQLGITLFLQRDGFHLLPGQLGFDHSLLGLIKFLRPQLGPAGLAHLWTWYAPLTAAAVLGFWFTRVRSLPLARQTLFLSVAMVFLPPVSYDYTLVELYPAFGLLVARLLRPDAAHRTSSWTAGTLACFAVVMTTQGWMILAGDHRDAQIKACALLVLLILAICRGKHDVSEGRSHLLQPEQLQRVL